MLKELEDQAKEFRDENKREAAERLEQQIQILKVVDLYGRIMTENDTRLG